MQIAAPRAAKARASSGFAAVERSASAGTKVPPALISLSAATAITHPTDVEI
jgi:hypothetical protein